MRNAPAIASEDNCVDGSHSDRDGRDRAPNLHPTSTARSNFWL
ncbi:MAG: hypothetical protein SVX43_19745 [Cyanobacteriota bacterium]|nr:hypothetical protein [Cyanobacteriota bacterium]